MIYVECIPDKALVKILGIPGNKIFHAGGKGNICSRLKYSKNSLGLIDEDPHSPQPNYIKKLKFQFKEYSIKVLYDDELENYLIVLCPRLEEWILKAAKEININMVDYQLPNEAMELHKVINTRIKKFENLVQSILQKSPMLKALTTLIKMDA